MGISAAQTWRVSVRRNSALVIAVTGLSIPAAAQPGSGATAQGTTTVSSAGPGNSTSFFANLVAGLDSPEYKVRLQASEQLTGSDAISLEQIERALTGPGAASLSPEQRQRLLDAGKARFSRSPRPAMGVGFDQTGTLRDRIIVERTFEKFACSKLLEEGDIIDAAAGMRLIGPSNRTILRSLIFSHEPGESIDLVVLRGAQRLKLSVPLGRYQDLENTVPLDPETVARAWRVRLHRIEDAANAAATTPAPTRSSLTTDEWRDTNIQARQRQAAASSARQATVMVGARTAPVAGGAARAKITDEGAMTRYSSLRDPDDLFLENLGWRLGPLWEDPDALGRKTMTTEEEVRVLETLVEGLRQKAARPEPGAVAPMPPPIAPPGRPRQPVAGGLAEGPIERQVRLLEKQIEAIKAEAAGN